jgi:hypothetical protein
MNELDFDKLLSMEDPLPEAKPKPEPEPAAPTPMPTEPEPEPEAEPAEMPNLTKPQRIGITVLTALVLAIGFFAGYLFRSAPTPEQTTAPPVTTAPPISTVPPSSDSALPVKEIYSDSFFLCHAYQQAVEIITKGEQRSFSDGISQYRLGETAGLYRSDLGYHNVWIRIELTQAGKERFGDGASLKLDRNLVSTIDWEEIHLSATPYYSGSDSTVDGWLVHGWMPEQASLSFQVIYTGGERHRLTSVSISPVVCEGNLAQYSTAALTRLVLHDGIFWRTHSGGLPEDLSDSPALAALSQRESSISVLMEYLLTGSSSEQKRAMATLKHKAFLDLMSSADRRAFYDMVDDYFSVTVYKERLTQVQTPPLVGERYGITYLLDSENAYRLGSPIPEPAEGEDPINFIARVDLSEYYITQYRDSWRLEAGDLLTWRYVNDEGQVAGWFVFGHLSNGGQIEFQLIDASGSNIPLYTKECTIAPQSGLVFAKSPSANDTSGDVLPQKFAYADNLMVCYAYQEAPRLHTTPGGSGGRLEAGAENYTLWEIPAELADLDPSEYNVWIRIELTEEGRKKYTDSSAVWLEEHIYMGRLGIVPYYTPSGALEGWFILGCATYNSSVPLQRQGINPNNPIRFFITPHLLWPADESVLLTTDLLVEQILTDDAMWNTMGDKLPDDLSERPLLRELSRRTNCIDMLLRYYAHSPATVWSRIDLILQHPSFARQMTPEQQALWAQRDQPRFSVETLSQRLTEYADGNDHYFTDGTTSWRISEAVPEAVKYIDPHEFNCYTRVTLSDFCRQVGYDGWFLRVRADGFITTLAAREYYDDSGALAGWFVYGKLSGEAEVTFWLENENAKTVESISLPLSPLA